MKRIILVAAATAAFAAIAPAAAQAPLQPQARTDRAQQVQLRAEVPGQVRAMFTRLDGNRDGLLTHDETQAGRKAVQGQRKIGQRNAMRGERGGAKRRIAAFDRVDADRNGMISRDEFARAGEQRAERRMAHLNRGGKGGMRLGGRMFGLSDVNRDSRVSLPEATNAALQRFDIADLNRDGQLTRDERMQRRQRARTERRPG